MAQSLQANDDGAFTIALFTDIHWTDGGPEDQRTSAFMDAVLDTEDPDFVVFNGDTIHGGKCADPAASMRAALEPVTALDLPWASVFGNHDDEGALDRAELMRVQMGLPGCLATPGPPTVSGVGNYVHTVFTRDGAPLAQLYFMDSHSYAQTGIGGYDWIKRDQIAWYLATASKLNATYGPDVPALVFFHIPLSEYNEVWDLRPCYGNKGEPICCPLVNSGMFTALHESGNVRGVFVGHDHVNDFEGTLYGIRLTFGRATGYGGYGRAEFARGARFIRLQAGADDYATWLHLADGTRITEQPRHAPEFDRKTCIL